MHRILNLAGHGGVRSIWVPGGNDRLEETTGCAGVPAPMIELVRAGRTPEELTNEFEPSA
jgi:hypothetical protein